MPVNLQRRSFLGLAMAGLLLAGCERTGRDRRLGLALGGGGAKGLAHIHMLEVLDELQLRPYRIAGTSIGAVIGALYAAGLTGKAIRRLVEQFLVDEQATAGDLLPLPESFRWLDFIDPALGRGGLLATDDFIAFLGDVLPVRRFRDLVIPLQVLAADLWTGEPVVIDKGDLLPALQASIALPGVFPPVDIDGRLLVDGGVAAPLPFDLLADDCDVVAAIDVSGDRKHANGEDFSFISVLFHSFHTMSRNIVAEKLRRYTPDIYIRPEIEDVRVLEFHKAQQVFAQSLPARHAFSRQLKRALDLRG